MSLILRVLDAAYCSSTHHKLALDALEHLSLRQADAWRDFLVTHHRIYFVGAKDPDKTFKDFRNHVLHVRDGYWGGAREQVRIWYAATVRALWRKDWSLAAYNAGVLSHYATDPLMPFHTGQSAAETPIHRAVEWSIRQNYDELRVLARTRTGYPHLETGTHPGWLDELVTAGAEISNGYYESLIEHFDFARSARNPKEGLDATGREVVSQMLAFATISLARILDRAFAEAGVSPPSTNPTLEGIFAMMDLPIAWVVRNIADNRESSLVEAQYREWRRSGVVEKHLTPDVREIRDRCEERRRQTSVPPEPVVDAPTGTAPSPVEEDAVAHTPRASLRLEDEVERAPSIGPKTAARLARCGIHTVGDLLAADASSLARQLGGWNKPALIRDWQDQARLLIGIPRLRALHAKILVGSGYRDPSVLAEAQPEELLGDVARFVDSEAGRRALHPAGFTPTLREMALWIGWAEEACPLDVRHQATATGVELAS